MEAERARVVRALLAIIAAVRVANASVHPPNAAAIPSSDAELAALPMGDLAIMAAGVVREYLVSDGDL